MKVGLFSALQLAPGEDVGKGWADFLEQVRLARDVGFKSLLIGQHVVTAPMQMLQPMPLLARLAEETEGMQIGPGILLMSMMNPVMVAEESATIDWLSDGRFVLAGGLGYRPEEFEVMGVDIKSRVSRTVEAIDVVKRLWTEERITHAGSHFRLTDVGTSIRPKQSPRPPIWLGGDVEAAVRRAAKVADAWLGAPTSTIDRAAELLKCFRDERAKVDAATDVSCPLIRECFVGKTQREAQATSRGPLLYKYKAYASWGQTDAEADFEAQFDDFASERFLIGDAHQVRDKVQEYQERLGVDHMLCRVQWPGLSQGETLDNIRRISEVFAAL